MSNSNGTVSSPPSTSTPTVHQATNAAKSLGLPADGRTANVLDLVVAGRVELHIDSATVQGGTAKDPHKYVVKDDSRCACYDAVNHPQPDGCKHVRASRIKRALGALTHHIDEFDHAEPEPELTCLAEVWGSRDDEPTFHDPQPVSSNGTTAVEVEDPPVAVVEPATAPHWNQAEPRFVHSVKWQEKVSGIEHMTIIRSDDWATLQAEIASVTRIAKTHRQPPEPGSPEAATLANDPAYCSIHGEHMKASKDGKGYFHKAGEKADGKAIWCRGK